MNWYLDPLTKHYADFDGRASRQQFWMYFVINLGVALALGVVDLVLTKAVGFGFLGYLYALATLVPGLALGVRRLHDIGKPWFWILIGLVPCVGWIVLLVLYAQPGQPGRNPFGPEPRADGPMG